MVQWADLPPEIHFRILCILFKGVSVCYAHFFVRDHRIKPISSSNNGRGRKVSQPCDIFSVLTVSKTFITREDFMSALLRNAKVVLHATSDIYKIAALLEEPYKNQLRHFQVAKQSLCHHTGDKKLGLGVIQYLFPNLRSIELTFPGPGDLGLDIHVDRQSRLLPLLAEALFVRGGFVPCVGQNFLQQQMESVAEARQNFDVQKEIENNLLTTSGGKPITTVIFEKLDLVDKSKAKFRLYCWFHLLMTEARSRNIRVKLYGSLRIGYMCSPSGTNDPQFLHQHNELVHTTFDAKDMLLYFSFWGLNVRIEQVLSN